MTTCVCFIGDTHLKCTSPVSRRDSYPTAILDKLEYVASTVNVEKCNIFILLGDVFDSPVTSLPYLATVIDTFKKISAKGITVYTIVGNHDIKNNRMDSLPSTALGILISTGYLKLAPKELIVENTILRCFNYPEEITPKLTNNYEVCVAHHYYNFGLTWDSLHEDDVICLNYDAMVLGHYHVPCDTELIGNTALYRPGSLSRCTSEPYNKLRKPRVLIFNCVNHKSVYMDVPCGSAEDVFINQVDSVNQPCMSMKDLIQFITTSYSSSDMNVREYFGNLEIPYECRRIVAKYLDAVGA